MIDKGDKKHTFDFPQYFADSLKPSFIMNIHFQSTNLP